MKGFFSPCTCTTLILFFIFHTAQCKQILDSNAMLHSFKSVKVHVERKSSNFVFCGSSLLMFLQRSAIVSKEEEDSEVIGSERKSRRIRVTVSIFSPCRVIDVADVVPFPDIVKNRSCCVCMVPPAVIGGKRTEKKFAQHYLKDRSAVITTFSVQLETKLAWTMIFFFFFFGMAVIRHRVEETANNYLHTTHLVL